MGAAPSTPYQPQQQHHQNQQHAQLQNGTAVGNAAASAAANQMHLSFLKALVEQTPDASAKSNDGKIVFYHKIQQQQLNNHPYAQQQQQQQQQQLHSRNTTISSPSSSSSSSSFQHSNGSGNGNVDHLPSLSPDKSNHLRDIYNNGSSSANKTSHSINIPSLLNSSPAHQLQQQQQQQQQQQSKSISGSPLRHHPYSSGNKHPHHSQHHHYSDMEDDDDDIEVIDDDDEDDDEYMLNQIPLSAIINENDQREYDHLHQQQRSRKNSSDMMISSSPLKNGNKKSSYQLQQHHNILMPLSPPRMSPIQMQLDPPLNHYRDIDVESPSSSFSSSKLSPSTKPLSLTNNHHNQIHNHNLISLSKLPQIESTTTYPMHNHGTTANINSSSSKLSKFVEKLPPFTSGNIISKPIPIYSKASPSSSPSKGGVISPSAIYQQPQSPLSPFHTSPLTSPLISASSTPLPSASLSSVTNNNISNPNNTNNNFSSSNSSSASSSPISNPKSLLSSVNTNVIMNINMNMNTTTTTTTNHSQTSSSKINHNLLPLYIKPSNGVKPTIQFNNSKPQSSQPVAAPVVEKKPKEKAPKHQSAPSSAGAGSDGNIHGNSKKSNQYHCTISSDGYQWRKYGQKNVKGTHFPRSYYKCTYPGCTVKKQMERRSSNDDTVNHVIYKGEHNHESPQTTRVNVNDQLSFKKSVISEGVMKEESDFEDESPMITTPSEQSHPSVTNSKVVQNNNGLKDSDMSTSIEKDSETTSNASLTPTSTSTSTQIPTQINNNSKNSGKNNNSSFNLLEQLVNNEKKIFDEYDNDNNNTTTTSSSTMERDIPLSPSSSSSATSPVQSSKLNGQSFSPTSATSNGNASGGVGSTKNPMKLVIETTSMVDHLDDGFNWRKYGQKAVKGSPFPKSYFKCAEPGCNVKKQVIQQGDKKFVNTYNGRHTHDPPSRDNDLRKRKRKDASSSIGVKEEFDHRNDGSQDELIMAPDSPGSSLSD